MHWTLWLWCYTSYKIRLIFWIEILIRFSGEDDWYDDFRNATSVVYTLASIHIWFGCPSVISRFPCQSAIVSYWRCAIQVPCLHVYSLDSGGFGDCSDECRRRIRASAGVGTGVGVIRHLSLAGGAGMRLWAILLHLPGDAGLCEE